MDVLKGFKSNYPHEADKLLVADSLVRFICGGGTRRASAVAVAGVSTAVVVSALVAELELTLARAARTLRIITRNGQKWF